MSYDLLIRSSSRASNSNNSSDFNIVLPESFDCRGKQFVELKYFQCYNTIFNINNSNNCLNFNENSTNKSITPITPSNYDAPTLASTLQTALNTASASYNTYSVTYSASTKLFTISAGNSFTLQFLTGTNSSTSLWKILGWTSSNGLAPVDSATNTSVTSPYMSNLSGPLSIYLTISKVGSTLRTSDNEFVSFYIPIDQPYGDLIEYRNHNGFKQTARVSDQLLKTFNVRLSCGNNQSLCLNGSEWEFIISVC